MSCDGTPGNPGLERVGDELYTCTGCPACNASFDIPWGLEHRRIGTEMHQKMEAFHADNLPPEERDEPQPTPEEMAAQMGVPLADLAGALTKGIGDLTEQLTEIAKAFQAPPKPSRAHRRAARFGQAKLHGNYDTKRRR